MLLPHTIICFVLSFVFAASLGRKQLKVFVQITMSETEKARMNWKVGEEEFEK